LSTSSSFWACLLPCLYADLEEDLSRPTGKDLLETMRELLDTSGELLIRNLTYARKLRAYIMLVDPAIRLEPANESLHPK
jgi:hypothetical protein